jgi:hypothetical protein
MTAPLHPTELNRQLAIGLDSAELTGKRVHRTPENANERAPQAMSHFSGQ